MLTQYSLTKLSQISLMKSRYLLKTFFPNLEHLEAFKYDLGVQQHKKRSNCLCKDLTGM